MSSSSLVKVAVARFNATLGDLSGNCRRIVDYAREAYAQGARVVVTPELSLCGYRPEDLLLRPAFMSACAQALADCAEELAELRGLQVVVGHPHRLGQGDDVRTSSP
jgi:NAD+ synthase (glutamine-hydrolysing)